MMAPIQCKRPERLGRSSAMTAEIGYRFNMGELSGEHRWRQRAKVRLC